MKKSDAETLAELKVARMREVNARKAVQAWMGEQASVGRIRYIHEAPAWGEYEEAARAFEVALLVLETP